MEKKSIIIKSTEYEALADLYTWLESEFEVSYIDTDGQKNSLGQDCSAIKVIIDFMRDNSEKFIKILKNWLYNFNRDIELSFENGDKKVHIKCPAKRISDDNLNDIISNLNDFFEKN